MCTTAVCASLLLAVSMLGQQPKKDWIDRGEYDLFNSCATQQDANKKLDCLKSWREKYPNSNFKHEGLTLSLTAYVALGKGADVAKTAKEILVLSPADLTALYYLTSMAANNTDPGALADGEKAATTLLASLDATFAADKKPANTPADAWAKARKDMELLGTRVLAWVATQGKDTAKTEKAIMTLLAMTPNDGEASYWMYTTIRGQKNAARNSEAFFYLARAATLTKDKGGFPDENRVKVNDFFVKAYNSYHGADDAGLAELRKLSLDGIKPPAGYVIKTSGEIASEKEKEFVTKNPQLAFWMNMKKELATAEGEKFFEERVKGAALPGKIEGTEFTRLKGRLISHKPAANPKELVLQMDTTQTNATDGDVILKFEKALNGKADPGIEIEFEGVAAAFTREPFALTFEVEKDNLVGWPVQAATPAKKAVAPVKKAIAPKKK
ncbi:MAG: hypothetical protein HYZ37_08975 [Candidatus Solibacter usitatus]|nr:hypothetical protein [Candidatus Solibacter usitatus]